MLEAFDLATMNHLSSAYVHTLAEALKLAFADRDHYYADPDAAAVPMDALLSTEYADLRRGLIDPHHAAATVLPGDPLAMQATVDAPPSSFGIGGTTTCVVCDRWGMTVPG